MKIRPLQDRIIVKRIPEEERTKGGIIIPDTAKEKPIEGRVVAVGNGKVLKNGKVRPLDVKPGDRVLFGKYAGNEVKIDGEEHLMLREEDILGSHREVSRSAAATSRGSTHGSERHRLHREGTRADPRGRQQARRRGEGHARPQGAQRRHREDRGARRPSPRTASPSPRRSSSRIASRTWARRWCARSRRRPATSPVTAPRPRPCSRRPSTAKASKLVAAGHNPMDIKRGIDKAVENIVAFAQEDGQVHQGSEGDRPGRRHQRERRQGDRRQARRGHGEGRQGRRHHRRGEQDRGDDARGRGRHAVRPRLPFALLRDGSRTHGGGARGRPTSSSARRRSPT